MTRSHNIRGITNINDRINRVHSAHNKDIVKAIKKLERFARLHNINIKIIIDGGSQGIGKTTHWIRHSINNTWITIVLVSTHYKAVEIFKDLELNPETFKKKIKPKLKYSIIGNTLRIHTLYSKDWKFTEEDWYVSPQFEGMDRLCILYRKAPKIFKLIKEGHLLNYCRRDDPENTQRCKYRYDCSYSTQFSNILEQIKGNRWQLLEKKIREYKKHNTIERKIADIQNNLNSLLKIIKDSKWQYKDKIIKEQGYEIIINYANYVKYKYPNLLNSFKKETGKNAIWRGKLTKGFISWINKKLKLNAKNKIKIEMEERKKIHHVIILPHIYLFLNPLDKLFNIFNNKIDAIIDENINDLIYDTLKITQKRAKFELKFLDNNSVELRGVNLDIYNQFKPIIAVLNIYLKYTTHQKNRIDNIKHNIQTLPYNSRAQEIERQRLEEYRNDLDNERSKLLSIKLVEFAKTFDEIKYQEDYINYINGIIKKHNLEIPNNLFDKISKLMSGLKSIINDNNNNNIEIDTKIDVDLRSGFIEFKINRMEYLNNLIDEVKHFVVFADAVAKNDIYKKILGSENRFLYMIYDDISTFDKFWSYPSNGKLNAKYQLWDTETGRFTNDGYNLLDRVAWLIKENKSKNLMITLYGEFNGWQREKNNILDGKFMIILDGKLRAQYNIEIKDIDVVLCFWYSDAGKDMFKDREVDIQFGCPGIPARGTKRLMVEHNLTKKQVHKLKFDGEQEQVAGRCRGFKHQIPVKHYLLTSRISSKFNNVKNINIVLKHRAILDYIREYGEMSTRQIQHDLFPDRELDDVMITLKKLADAEIGLYSKLTSSNLKLWFFEN